MPPELTIQELLDEIEALKADRAWEARRANEAARLSAEARDQADHLRREIANLGGQVVNLERERLDRTAWALGVIERHGIPGDVVADDEFAAIAAHLDRAARVLETARAWRGPQWLDHGASRPAAARRALVAAVDALDGVA